MLMKHTSILNCSQDYMNWENKVVKGTGGQVETTEKHIINIVNYVVN